MASSREHLVGRPLVPFFDADDNVNEALRVDHSTRATEQLDVDARVWDRELGYFVYPTQQQQQQQTVGHSQPIAIKRGNESDSGLGRTLLTPDMLFSRSAPTASTDGFPHRTITTAQPTVSIEHNDAANAATPRSASAKRASRQKSRSGTPTRARNKAKAAVATATTDGGSSGGEGSGRSGSDSNDKSKKNSTKATDSTPKKTRNNNKKQDKATEDLSANGKWAWSAFQSSPDPKSLPLPPFAIGGTSSPGLGALPPPKDPPNIDERLDPPPPPPQSTIEHSMTQDLRRLLNIGS